MEQKIKKEEQYRALVVREEKGSGRLDEKPKSVFHAKIETLAVPELQEGEIEILSHYSSLNYKDALSLTGNKGVSKKYPHVPGIDVSGVVKRSRSADFSEGDPVFVTGYALGMSVFGGFAERVYVPASWAFPLPKNLTLEEVMIYGTAGFTAAQSVDAMLQSSKLSDLPAKDYHQAEIAISGATGGVGILATLILKHLGFRLAPISRKEEAPSFFKSLDIEGLIHPKTLLQDEDAKKPLLKTRWHGAIDTVGGDMLSYFLKTTDYRSTVACCGMVGGLQLNTSIFPFILRGVTLSGIDSALCPRAKREEIWQKLSLPWKPEKLNSVCRVIALAEVEETLHAMLRGENVARVVLSHFPVEP